MKTHLKFLVSMGFALALLVISCKDKVLEPVKSAEKAITAFAFNSLSPAVTATVSGTSIAAAVPSNTDLTALAPTIATSAKATVSPASGAAQNFTNPVTYTITAEDGTKQTYTVTVTKGAAPKSTEKVIKTFAFNGLSPAVTATIDATAKTISATVPATADLTKLISTITLSDKATVSPATGVAQDFSKAVTYTVTAEDGSTQEYKATISAISNTFSDIVQKAVPLDIIQSAKSVGIILYGGNNPPKIEGTYRMADCIISDADDKSLINRTLQPITYNFANYNLAVQSIEQRLKQSNGDNGTTVTTYYVSGSGNLFTLFSTFTNASGQKFYDVFSGEFSATGIKNFVNTTFYYQNNKAVVSTALSDKDGFSEKQATF